MADGAINMFLPKVFFIGIFDSGVTSTLSSIVERKVLSSSHSEGVHSYQEAVLA